MLILLYSVTRCCGGFIVKYWECCGQKIMWLRACEDKLCASMHHCDCLWIIITEKRRLVRKQEKPSTVVDDTMQAPDYRQNILGVRGLNSHWAKQLNPHYSIIPFYVWIRSLPLLGFSWLVPLLKDTKSLTLTHSRFRLQGRSHRALNWAATTGKICLNYLATQTFHLKKFIFRLR